MGDSNEAGKVSVTTPRDFIRATLTAPSSSCQVDLDGIGNQHERGTAVYLLIDAERTAGWHLGPPSMKPDEKVRVVHVISRWAGGDIRGYVWHRNHLHLRHPCSPESWPELDALVAQVLGVS